FEEFQEKGLINFYGRQNDVRVFLKNANAIINPSYHEGMSNVLLEAAASGRPILASEVPGCIETFEEGITGFGFQVKNVNSLNESIKSFIELPYIDKKNIGIEGRKKMEREFNREIIVKAYINKVKEILED